MGLFKSIMSVISTDGKTGTPFNLDKNHTVYYKGNGVTKTDAAHVGGFFKGYGYFTDTNQSDVQIASSSPDGPVNIGFVIGVKSVSETVENFFRDSKKGLQEFFPGRMITLSLMNADMKELKKL